jgi:hypothetical protein
MSIRYSTNWMGPISIDWYRKRGLTTKDENGYDQITESYSAGRIDVRDGSDFGDEISVPPMKTEDWHRFGNWLETFETDFTWTLEQLVELYERKNPRICWEQELKNDVQLGT